jgi:hypothetical protein
VKGSGQLSVVSGQLSGVHVVRRERPWSVVMWCVVRCYVMRGQRSVSLKGTNLVAGGDAPGKSRSGGVDPVRVAVSTGQSFRRETEA